MGARLFTAVLPPDHVVAELDELLEPRREAGRELWRWTKPEGWHLTTAFMASVTPLAQDLLVEGLKELAERTEPFRIRVGGALFFPDVARARMMTLGVTSGTAELEALAANCRGVASHAGASPDGATFRGHLTLGRARRAFDATKWFHVIDSFPGWSWDVEELVLVESHMSDAGYRYETLERLPLRGA